MLALRGSNWQGNPTTGDYTVFGATTRRGFTGHEMLDSASLVHMNGRVYDPYLGRVLSVDPIVPTLGLSQAVNPFSYVMNNPLSLTDPSGYSWLGDLFHDIGHAISSVFKKAVDILTHDLNLIVGYTLIIVGTGPSWPLGGVRVVPHL